MKENTVGIIIILGIIMITLFGGAKGVGNNSIFSPTPTTPTDKQTQIQQQIDTTNAKVQKLKTQLAAEEARKTQSIYKDIVRLDYISRSTNPSQEYVTIRVGYGATTTIPVTGWKLKSTSTGNEVTIPKGTYLYFINTNNTEDNIVLNSGDTVYLVTGVSPIGANFKSNKCSGYLSQSLTFTPYLSSSCPAPRNEDLSSIPKSPVNDTCLDYIDSMNSCRTQTESLPVNWTYECTNFIYTKINYASCVDTHRKDKDFYQNEWRVYLKRSDTLWKDRRENVVLYDNSGKVVDSISYQ